ncbi:Spo11/DNA topoisomerase VI subunit A [Poronia punctata]|nr:Spo11/DNA topoisomerase VI subunit A [Poronia punctata]
MEDIIEHSDVGLGSVVSLASQSLPNPGRPRRPLRGRLNSTTQAGRTVIDKIEAVLSNVMASLADLRVMEISMRSRSTGKEQTVQFPASTETEAKRFTAILLILHLSYENLVAGTVITKRAIYYQNTDLFGSQRYVDNLVNDIAFSFGVGRDALNIVAASKGLLAGPISLKMGTGSILDCNSDGSQGTLLPQGPIVDYNVGPTKWVLVIEKEATFRGLVASSFHNRAMAGPGVLVTAKGYPDLATRRFLHALATKFLRIPVLALMDFNPHGMRIMLTYKNGSESLRHEEDITTNRLAWIGPKSNDIFPYLHRNWTTDKANRSSLHHMDIHPIGGTSSLSANDRKLAIHLLDTLTTSTESHITEEDESSDLGYIGELQAMLFLNIKAEIQAVDEAGDLTRWLNDALVNEICGER